MALPLIYSPQVYYKNKKNGDYFLSFATKQIKKILVFFFLKHCSNNILFL